MNEIDKDSSIYLTHEWLSTWWKYFGKGKKLNILLVEKARRVIGIVPLMRTEYKIGLVGMHFLETIGATNCNYIALTLPENREEATAALIAYLEKELNESKHALRFSFVP
ncbi:MAG: hypothetical protein MUP21_12620, partial [Dehalococcoidia bacterium]|nr:hypothetical protein [Dehalococcoidia bacterium]